MLTNSLTEIVSYAVGYHSPTTCFFAESAKSRPRKRLAREAEFKVDGKVSKLGGNVGLRSDRA